MCEGSFGCATLEGALCEIIHTHINHRVSIYSVTATTAADSKRPSQAAASQLGRATMFRKGVAALVLLLLPLLSAGRARVAGRRRGAVGDGAYVSPAQKAELAMMEVGRRRKSTRNRLSEAWLRRFRFGASLLLWSARKGAAVIEVAAGTAAAAGRKKAARTLKKSAEPQVLLCVSVCVSACVSVCVSVCVSLFLSLPLRLSFPLSSCCVCSRGSATGWRWPSRSPPLSPSLSLSLTSPSLSLAPSPRHPASSAARLLMAHRPLESCSTARSCSPAPAHALPPARNSLAIACRHASLAVTRRTPPAAAASSSRTPLPTATSTVTESCGRRS